MHQDVKKENPASIWCLTMLLPCLRDSPTDPLRFMMAELRFTAVELGMLRMCPPFDMVLALFKLVAQGPPLCTVFVMNWGESGCQ